LYCFCIPTVVTIVEEVTVFPELACDDNKRRSRRIAEIKIKEQVVPNEQYDDIDMSKKRDKIGKKMSTPTKKVHLKYNYVYVLHIQFKITLFVTT